MLQSISASNINMVEKSSYLLNFGWDPKIRFIFQKSDLSRGLLLPGTIHRHLY